MAKILKGMGEQVLYERWLSNVKKGAKLHPILQYPCLGRLTPYFTFSMLLNDIVLSQIKANIYRENNDQKDV
ncbi:hypothetical protein KP24_06175 [Pectobacterium atrosepticum]|uniref:hypothetical protein n=1 Tax=Pectobacterium atrosepticum TaxID=29471 RepID=UPI000504BE88|nr:hypothetical protein [Pectobacterium atrosepticum]KFX24639.1 hypothetical protein KP24_06175 [Pectobacterium atrosepticum]